MHNLWDLQSGIERGTDNNSFQQWRKGSKELSLKLNLGMQNTNDAWKLSKGDYKTIGVALIFRTIPKEHTNFVFYPILE